MNAIHDQHIETSEVNSQPLHLPVLFSAAVLINECGASSSRPGGRLTQPIRPPNRALDAMTFKPPTVLVSPKDTKCDDGTCVASCDPKSSSATCDCGDNKPKRAVSKEGCQEHSSPPEPSPSPAISSPPPPTPTSVTPTPEATVVPVSPKPKVASSLRSPSSPTLTTFQERERFLIFVRILFKCLDEKDPQLRAKAKRVVQQCTLRNREGNPEYAPLVDVVERRLRCIVGEANWTRAEYYLRHYLARTNNQRSFAEEGSLAQQTCN